MANWKEIWSRSRNFSETKMNLQSLIEADGFNSGAGKIGAGAWLAYTSHVAEMIKMLPHDSLFEVGCGSGAFLYPFYQQGHKVSGIDYSSPLIELASQVMPDMKFNVHEALEIECISKYNIVLANSVFQYFPSMDYAEEVLRLMYEKANRVVVLLDLNDVQFADEALSIRKGALSEGEYEKKYAGLNHLFFDRDFAARVLKGKRFMINTSNQQIDSYGNNKFRFNVVIEKW